MLNEVLSSLATPIFMYGLVGVIVGFVIKSLVK